MACHMITLYFHLPAPTLADIGFNIEVCKRILQLVGPPEQYLKIDIQNKNVQLQIYLMNDEENSRIPQRKEDDYLKVVVTENCG